MRITEIPLDQLHELPGNPNHMDEAIRRRLHTSLERFGLVEPLVIRSLEISRFEVLSGNQRLAELRQSEAETAPCVIVELDDADAMLLAQAMNHISGEDDLGLRAELLRKVLGSVSEDEVLSLLPETTETLEALASLGEQDIAHHLLTWQKSQAARLKHLQVQLTADQMNIVDRAIEKVTPEAKELQGNSPNLRGTAIFAICLAYLNHMDTKNMEGSNE